MLNNKESCPAPIALSIRSKTVRAKQSICPRTLLADRYNNDVIIISLHIAGKQRMFACAGRLDLASRQTHMGVPISHVSISTRIARFGQGRGCIPDHLITAYLDTIICYSPLALPSIHFHYKTHQLNCHGPELQDQCFRAHDIAISVPSMQSPHREAVPACYFRCEANNRAPPWMGFRLNRDDKSKVLPSTGFNLSYNQAACTVWWHALAHVYVLPLAVRSNAWWWTLRKKSVYFFSCYFFKFQLKVWLASLSWKYRNQDVFVSF